MLGAPSVAKLRVSRLVPNAKCADEVLPNSRLFSNHRQHHAKQAATARPRTHLHWMLQQVRQALHDRQADAEPLRAVTSRVVDLVELLEDSLQVLRILRVEIVGLVGDRDEFLAQALDLRV